MWVLVWHQYSCTCTCRCQTGSWRVMVKISLLSPTGEWRRDSEKWLTRNHCLELLLPVTWRQHCISLHQKIQRMWWKWRVRDHWSHPDLVLNVRTCELVIWRWLLHCIHLSVHSFPPSPPLFLFRSLHLTLYNCVFVLASSSSSANLLPNTVTNTRQIGVKHTVELKRGPRGFGFGLSSRDVSTSDNDHPVYIKSIHSDGPAFHDGRLRIGDRILEVWIDFIMLICAVFWNTKFSHYKQACLYLHTCTHDYKTCVWYTCMYIVHDVGLGILAVENFREFMLVWFCKFYFCG